MAAPTKTLKTPKPSRIGQLLDSAIAPLSPTFARKRTEERLRLQRAQAFTQSLAATYEEQINASGGSAGSGVGFSAGKHDRTTGDFFAHLYAADAALPDFDTMVARGRRLTQNTSVGAAIRHAYHRNIIGDGITCRATPANQGDPGTRDIDQDQAAQLDDDFNAEMDDRLLIDAEGKNALQGQAGLVLTEAIATGNALPILNYNAANAARGYSGLQLQMAEYEQLDHTFDTPEHSLNPGSHRTRHGIESDSKHRRIRYHFQLIDHPYSSPGTGSSRLPGVPGRQGQRPRGISADRVLHFQLSTRVQETLAPPWLAPILTNAWNTDQFDYWERMAKKIEAYFALTIEDDGPAATLPAPPDPTGTQATTQATNTSVEEVLLEGGGILNHGQKLVHHTSNRPGPQYQAYMQTQMAQIAAGVNRSTSSITRQFEGTYVNGRMASIEDWKADAIIQRVLIQEFYNRIRLRWLDLMVLQGRYPKIDPRRYFGDPRVRRAYARCEWLPPRIYAIDPAKDEAATFLKLANGRSSLQREGNRDGHSWMRDVAPDMLAERQYIQDNDIYVPWAQAPQDTHNTDSPNQGSGSAGQPKPRGQQNDPALAQVHPRLLAQQVFKHAVAQALTDPGD